MKINPESDLNDELRPEYTGADLKNRVRGKFVHLFAEAKPIVELEADVASVFPDAVSVNEALRFLIRITRDNANSAVVSQ